VYRFWRDLGYAIGALLSGLVADAIDLEAAIHVVAALTLLSGGVVGLAMRQPAPGPTSGSLAATMREKRRASR
jgi:predicted MFS family arabinose efflux permease